MFYMVVQNDQIIDALSEIVYVRKQITHGNLIICNAELAEGILSYDCSSIWFVPDLITENVNEYPIVSLQEIDEEKYKVLRNALDKDCEVPCPKPEQPTPNEPDNQSGLLLECIQTNKINEMSKICNQRILSGFNMVLDDGQTHHFDFTLEEQANLMYAKLCIDNGATKIPYHASDEPCRFFTADEIKKIINVGTNMRILETTYFNSLKLYIKSMNTIEEVNSVVYGMNIPEQFQSEVMTEIKKKS